MTRLSWPGWLGIETVYPQAVTHLSTNPARRRVTLLVYPHYINLQLTYLLNVNGFTAGSRAYTTDDVDVINQLFADDGSLYVSSQHREDRLSTLITITLVWSTTQLLPK